MGFATRSWIQKKGLFLVPLFWLPFGIPSSSLFQADPVPTSPEYAVEAATIPQVSRLELIEENPPRFEIIINIPATQLTLYDNGIPVGRHKISVGTPRWPTPVGKFEIYEIQWNPWWLPPESDWAKNAEKTPPGPNNPLYPVKLMMDHALRIHGTRSTWSIGRAASHGCMRMRREEIRNLAEYLESEIVPNHDPTLFEKYRKTPWQPYRTVLPKDNRIWVYMIYQPFERWSNQLVLHPNYYGRRIPYEEHLFELLEEAGIYDAPIDLGKFHELRKKSRETTTIPFQDLLYEGVDQETLPLPFKSVCLVGEDRDLHKVRDRYNTRFESIWIPKPNRSLPGKISQR